MYKVNINGTTIAVETMEEARRLALQVANPNEGHAVKTAKQINKQRVRCKGGRGNTNTYI